jgi:hypothetical protein
MKVKQLKMARVKEQARRMAGELSSFILPPSSFSSGVWK